MMDVHIVWCEPNGDKIIDRHMRLLAEGNNWTLSDQPCMNADLNHSGLYIDFAQRFTDWHKTPWSAHFSHLEAHMPYKKFWWETAARMVDIKTITAAQYGKMLSGKVIKVTPPVEPQFVIREKKHYPRPRVGVSGFVAPGGRKGEHLVAQLARDLQGKVDIVASGKGWTVPTVNDRLEGLSAFYNSLDLYLCTSLIEGIPMPPLEALACGIPVLIPVGVGMLDDLPVVPGITRYQVGKYESLRRTLEGMLPALSDINREALREAVKDYTPQAWSLSHRKGFERMLYGEELPQPAPEVRTGVPQKAEPVTIPVIVLPERKTIEIKTGQRGVYYVAYGKPARDCAIGAIHSFKKHFPNIPVALVSDRQLGPEDIFIEHKDVDIGARLPKVKIYDLAPQEWQYVLYIDIDTEIISSSEFFWQLVEDGWDLAICKNPARFHITRHMVRPDNKDECEETWHLMGSDELIQYNGGIFSFQRNERTAAFFHDWHQEWLRYGKRDQAALLRALWKNPLKLFLLTNEWNTIVRNDPADIAAFMLHFPTTARRHEGVVPYRSDSEEAWRIVRQHEGGR